MAVRYSGGLTIRIRWSEGTGPLRPVNGEYRCSIASTRGDRAVVHVNAPTVLSMAVDAPEAYDVAARAAIAFAPDDLSDVADSDDKGYAVARKRA